MRFWTKIFAVSFAMGVVSGIVLSLPVRHQLEPLLGRRRQRDRPADRLRGADARFSWRRPSSASCCSAATACRPGCTCCRPSIVAVGTAMSAFWILSANSWMQTPAGHEMRDGVAYPGRLARDHVQSELSLSLRAHAQRRLPDHGLRRAGGRRALSARRQTCRGRRAPCCAWRSGCWPSWRRCSCCIGDQHGLNTLQASADQDRGDGRRTGTAASPATSTSSPGRTRRPRPTGSRFRSRAAPRSILTHDPNGLFPGLKSVPPADRPPVSPVFFAFRIMLGDRLLHDRGGAVRRIAVVARRAVRDALVSARRWRRPGGSASSR